MVALLAKSAADVEVLAWKSLVNKKNVHTVWSLPRHFTGGCRGEFETLT